MNKPDRRIQALGEVAIRVRNLDAMQQFYQDVVGLELLRRSPSFAFFTVAKGYGGHSQILALFDATNQDFLDPKSSELNPAGTTLHHIALNVALDDFEPEKLRLESLGLKVNATVHEWLHVRSVYFSDPEGNMLEFVAYDETVV
jgi:catechol 2,3-dioxygenase-like lactoylglutathione lyase family enzyme